MKNYFEYLESIGINDAHTAYSVLEEMNGEQLFEVLGECFKKINSSRNTLNSAGMYDFAANNNISGGLAPCSSPGCRINEAYSLSVFTVLYSDTVTIPNFFDDYYFLAQKEYPPLDFENKDAVTKLRNELFGSIAVYYQYKPLIEAGLVYVNKTLEVICKKCLKDKQGCAERILDKVESRNDNIKRHLLGNVDFILTSGNYIAIEDPNNYLGLEGYSVKSLYNVRPTKGRRKLETSEIQELKLDEYAMEYITNDIMSNLYYENLRDKTYLTNRGLDLDILKTINTETKDRVFNPFDLSHAVPFVKDANISELIKLRNAEQEAFNVYRDSLNKVINLAENHDLDLNKALSEGVRPAINEIDHLLQNYKNDLRLESKKEVIVGSSWVAGGFITKEYLPELSGHFLLKGSHTFSKLFKNLSDLRKEPRNIKDRQFYFLWKAENKANHS